MLIFIHLIGKYMWYRKDGITISLIYVGNIRNTIENNLSYNFIYK